MTRADRAKREALLSLLYDAIRRGDRVDVSLLREQLLAIELAGRETRAAN